MAEDVGQHTSRASYFSPGALVGATFVGLWVGSCMAAMQINLLGGFVLGAMVGLPIAAVLALPVSAVLAIVVFPLTRQVRGRWAPTNFNAAILGAAVGILAVLVATALQGMISDAAPGLAEPRPFRLSEMLTGLFVIPAGLVGGAAAGITYRALLVYKYPTILPGANRQGFS